MYFQEVVSFVLVKEDFFLAEKRKETKKVTPGALVTPVGKIEEGETPKQAMMREALEELSIVPKEFKLVCSLKYKYPDHISRIYYFMINSWEGEIKCNEAEKVHWINFNDINKLSLEVDQIAINEFLRTKDYPY